YHFMGTNAYGSAYLAAKLFANGLLIDMGTSSTDIISIIDHEPKMIAAKHQNRNRLATGELSFSGLLYTQIEYLLHEVPFAGVTTKICPGIAWTGHVYALLGKINAAT